MENIKIGDYNNLIVKKLALREGNGTSFGFYLDGGREGDILMPEKYVPKGTEIGDEIRVFVYLDQEERLIATTETPLVTVDKFAYLECSWVNKYGAFLNWGVMKDLFCPFCEQKQRMRIGEKYIVYVHIDPITFRLVASAKIEKYFNSKLPTLKKNQEVSLRIWQKTDIGFKVIINDSYPGLIYKDQIFTYIHIGEEIKGYIQTVRPDGKIDCGLQEVGRKHTKDFADILLEYLEANRGKCELGDKSEPEDIRRQFQVSKKVYKKAVGELYKKRLIRVYHLYIELIDKK